jgi:hypothetical protein
MTIKKTFLDHEVYLLVLTETEGISSEGNAPELIKIFYGI